MTVRRFFAWLTDQGHVAGNPAKKVKELKRVALAPKGLARSEVRRLLREVELREDVRAAAVFSILLYTGCRVSDLVNLELTDLTLGERSGTVVFRLGKGNKQRSAPLPLLARRALQAYLDIRPPVQSDRRSDFLFHAWPCCIFHGKVAEKRLGGAKKFSKGRSEKIGRRCGFVRQGSISFVADGKTSASHCNGRNEDDCSTVAGTVACIHLRKRHGASRPFRGRLGRLGRTVFRTIFVKIFVK